MKRVTFVGLCDCGKCKPEGISAEFDDHVADKALELQSHGIRLTARPTLNREFVTFAAIGPQGGLPIAHAFGPNRAGSTEAAAEMISVAYAMVTYKFDTYE